MEKQAKDLSVYKKKFDDDIMSFREYEAMDYIRELKNQDRLDEAIEVGRVLLDTRPELKTYINNFGYALYNKYIASVSEQTEVNENLYFDMVKEILHITKQEKYSPYESVVNHVIKYASNKKPIDYAMINQYLDHLDPTLLSKKPFITKSDKEGESRFERWYRLKVRALYEIENYKDCIFYANQALAQSIKWHYRNLQWICYYKAMSNLKLKNYDECEKDFLSLQGQINNIDFYRALFELHTVKGNQKEANTYLLYDLFISGYNSGLLPLYNDFLVATKATNDEKLIEIVSVFIDKLKEETNQLAEDDIIDEKYKENNSSDLYDRMMNELVNKLSLYLDRATGKVVHYNEEKNLGTIVSDEKNTLFFRQSDFIFDEEVKKYDGVEYTEMKAYDSKKGVPTTKAVLLLINENFDNYFHF